MSKPRATHSALLAQADGLIAFARSPETQLRQKNQDVSNWCVGEHVEHIAVVNLVIVKNIHEALNAEHDAKAGVTMIGRLVLWTGFIPRGRGKAPESTLPGTSTAPELILEKLIKHRKELQNLESHLDEIGIATGRSPHPKLGQFTAGEWLQFIGIHNRHHLKIISEITRVPFRF